MRCFVPADVFAIQRDSPVRDENSPLQRWPCRVEKGVGGCWLAKISNETQIAPAFRPGLKTKWVGFSQTNTKHKTISVLKHLLICLCIFGTLQSLAQGRNGDGFPIFKKEVRSAIDKLRKDALYKGRKSVYIIDLCDPGTAKNAFCFKMQYIVLAKDYNDVFIKASYMFRIDSDIILVNTKHKYGRDWMINKEILSINTKDKSEIKNKLLHKNLIMDGHSAGYVCWYDGQTIRRRYFENENRIPDRINTQTFLVYPKKMEEKPVPTLPGMK